ncbi:MAG: cation:proton antiporter [Actinomycetota bacterium]|nr:cation:proton antiporter [Actinomycetota bacterium]
MSAQEIIETVAIMLAAGLASDLVAGTLRLPPMVVLLAAGALLGPHALDAVDAPLDSVGVELLLTLGVSFILFHGGLGLSVHVLRPVAVGLGLLSVPGVVLTALVTGAVAALAFDVPFEAGFLVGAVLAPTDPAILIPLLDRVRLRRKVAETVIAESALNDPVGAVLALSIAAFIVHGGGSFVEPLGEFAVDLGISTGLGIAFGLVLAVAISHLRAGIWRETPEIAVLFFVAAGYFSINSAGGSGYLGAFVAGLIVGNMDTLRLGMHSDREVEMRSFAAVASDVMVIFVFITLGANLPFDRLGDDAAPALATLAALIFLARPVTVLTCLLSDRRGRWKWGEIAFVAWTRETAVVPAAVAGVLVARGIPYEDELLTTVALAIVVTLLVQATTKQWLARVLRLDEAEP